LAAAVGSRLVGQDALEKATGAARHLAELESRVPSPTDPGRCRGYGKIVEAVSSAAAERANGV
jgi:hypothetical protein